MGYAVLCSLSTQVKPHFWEEAFVVEHQHGLDKNGEAQEEQKNPILFIA
jgi:hypothetical protein